MKLAIIRMKIFFTKYFINNRHRSSLTLLLIVAFALILVILTEFYHSDTFDQIQEGYKSSIHDFKSFVLPSCPSIISTSNNIDKNNNNGKKKSDDEQPSRFLILEHYAPSWMGFSNQVMHYADIMMIAFLANRNVLVLPKRRAEHETDPSSFIDYRETEKSFTRLMKAERKSSSPESQQEQQQHDIHINNNKDDDEQQILVKIMTYEEFMQTSFYKKQVVSSTSSKILEKYHGNSIKVYGRALNYDRQVALARKQAFNSELDRVRNCPIIYFIEPYRMWQMNFDPLPFHQDEQSVVDGGNNAVLSFLQKRRQIKRNRESPARIQDSIVFSKKVRTLAHQYLDAIDLFGDHNNRHDGTNKEIRRSDDQQYHEISTKSHHQSPSKSTIKIAVPFHARFESDMALFRKGTLDAPTAPIKNIMRFMDREAIPKLIKRISSALTENNNNYIRRHQPNNHKQNDERIQDKKHFSAVAAVKVIIKVILFSGPTLDVKIRDVIVDRFVKLATTLNQLKFKDLKFDFHEVEVYLPEKEKVLKKLSSPSSFLISNNDDEHKKAEHQKQLENPKNPWEGNIVNLASADETSKRLARQEKKQDEDLEIINKNNNMKNNKKQSIVVDGLPHERLNHVVPFGAFETAVDMTIGLDAKANFVTAILADYSAFDEIFRKKKCCDLEIRGSLPTYYSTIFDAAIMYDYDLKNVRVAEMRKDLRNCYSAAGNDHRLLDRDG